MTDYRAYEQGRESPTNWDAEPLPHHRRPRSPSPNPITQVGLQDLRSPLLPELCPHVAAPPSPLPFPPSLPNLASCTIPYMLLSQLGACAVAKFTSTLENHGTSFIQSADIICTWCFLHSSHRDFACHGVSALRKPRPISDILLCKHYSCMGDINMIDTGGNPYVVRLQGPVRLAAPAVSCKPQPAKEYPWTWHT